MKTGESRTSSIGACWPPALASNERVRGFYPEVVLPGSKVDDFVDEFEHQLKETSRDAAATRLSVRLLGSAAAITAIEVAGIKVEGALPVSGEEVFIAYTAWNHAGRSMSEVFLDRHCETIAAAMRKEVVSENPIERLVSKGFLPLTVDRMTPAEKRIALAPKFFELYGKFGYNEDEVKELLVNDMNTICYLTDDKGDVVSTVLAEEAKLELDDHASIVVAEVTEAITRSDLQGRGLYSALSRFLVEQVVAQQHGSDNDRLQVLYGESNLSSPGVIHAARKNGRNFSHHDGSIFGIERRDFGILEQNFSVNDGVEQRPYNDFALSYIPLG